MSDAAPARLRAAPIVVLVANLIVGTWAVYGWLGLAWLLENRAHESLCAAMGVIPLQGPAGFLGLVLALPSFLVGRTRQERLLVRIPWALLALVQVVYWTLFWSLPDASKC